MAALATVGLWVPVGWWKPLVKAGASLSIVLMLAFLGPTKLMPIVLAFALIAGTLRGWWRPSG